MNGTTYQASELINNISRGLESDHISDRLEVTFRGVNGAVGKRDDATHMLPWYPATMFYKIP